MRKGIGDGCEEGTGVRRPPEGDDALRLLTSTRVRFGSISSKVGLRGRLSEPGAPGGEGRLREDEIEPRCEILGRGDAAVCRLPFDTVGECTDPLWESVEGACISATR